MITDLEDAPVMTPAERPWADLARREPALTDFERILDTALRAELVGEHVEVTRLRYKPGATLIAAVRSAEGRRFWLESHADPTKLLKSAKRARRIGAGTRHVGHSSLYGPMRADRLLADVIAQTFGTATDGADVDLPCGSTSGETGMTVLRYNPQRRLVVRRGSNVLKLFTDEPDLRAVHVLSAQGLPVLRPIAISHGVTATPWWGTGDLAHILDENTRDRAEAERAAATALAGVHDTLVDVVIDAGAPGTIRRIEPHGEANVALQAVSTLCPAVEPRVRHILDRAVQRISGELVVSHGDWSPDQVLVSRSEIRLIDFDRLCLAPRERDLGSYLAAGGTEAFLQAYEDAGGAFDHESVGGWQAISRIQRSIDAFRAGRADWQLSLEAQLRAADEAVGRR